MYNPSLYRKQQMYDRLKTEDKILVNLLSARCCTSEIIQEAFGYANLSGASGVLNKLVNKGYLYASARFKGYSQYAYFLTDEGSERAYICIGDTPYSDSNPRDGGCQVRPKFAQQRHNKIKPGAIPHALGVSRFYFTLLDIYGYGNFEWELMSGMLGESLKTSEKAQGDARFAIDKRNFFLEYDMGTERRNALETRMKNYMNFGEEGKPYPDILFVVDIGISLNSISYSNDNKIAALTEESKSLKGAKNYAKYIESHKGKSIEELRSLAASMEEVIKGTAKSRQTKDLQTELSAINDLLNGKTPAIDKKTLDYQYNECLIELRDLRKGLLYAQSSGMIESRIKTITQVLLTYNDMDMASSMFYRLLDGLDVYVNSLKVVKMLVSPNGNKSTDIIAQFCVTYISHCYPRCTAEIKDNVVLDFYDVPVKVKKAVRIGGRGHNGTWIIIEDFSGNNVGAYGRICWIARHTHDIIGKSEVKVIAIIDKTDYVQNISQIAFDSHNNPKHFYYVDASRLRNKSPDKDCEYISNQIYNVDNAGSRSTFDV